VSDQEHGQEHPEKSIECQTETQPPVGHAGIVDEEVMDDVKDPMTN
jgi:hypothetical protein